MKITRVEAWSVDMTLAEPYTIAYETISRTTTVFLRVETNADISGFGCATPDEAVTGETPHSALSALDAIAGPILKGLKGADPLSRARILARLRRELPNDPSARAAADMRSTTFSARQRRSRCGESWAAFAVRCPPVSP